MEEHVIIEGVNNAIEALDILKRQAYTLKQQNDEAKIALDNKRKALIDVEVNYLRRTKEKLKNDISRLRRVLAQLKRRYISNIEYVVDNSELKSSIFKEARKEDYMDIQDQFEYMADNWQTYGN
jgi:hypothetical protein